MLFHWRSLKASTVYLIYSVLSTLFFSIVVTVNLVYQVEVAKLTPLQLVLVGTALETVCFFCQIPTGVLADVYSRRLAVIVGVLIVGIGFIIEGSFPHFVTIVLAQVLFGIGATFTDGAEQAWITDEVGEERVGALFLHANQFSLFGGLLAALISVWLASIQLNIPIVVGGVGYIMLAGFLFLFMPEHGFKPTPKAERQSWRAFSSTFSAGLRVVRMRPILLTILLIELFYGLSSEGMDRLSTAHFLTNFTFPVLLQLKPVVWFGVFSIIGTVVSLGATELVRRYVNTNEQRIVVRFLFLFNAVAILCVIAFGLVGNFYVAVTAFILYGVFRGIGQPLYTTWLTQNIDATVRATVISMNGQVNALGQVFGGPPVGYIGIVSLRLAMVSVGVILLPVLLLLGSASRKLKKPAGSLETEKPEFEPV